MSRRSRPRRRGGPRAETRELRVAVKSIVRTGHIVALPRGGLPRLGWEAFRADGTPVGVVSDIIGSVEKPYVVVRPASREALETLKLEEELLVRPPRREGRPRPRRGGGGHGGVREKGRGRVGERDMRGHREGSGGRAGRRAGMEYREG